MRKVDSSKEFEDYLDRNIVNTTDKSKIIKRTILALHHKATQERVKEVLKEIKEPLMDLQGGRGNSHFENGVRTATDLIDHYISLEQPK